MSEESVFNSNPEIVKMREEIASRAFRIKLVGTLLTVGLAVGALALMATGVGSGIGSLMLPAVVGLGSALAGMVTFKATERLKVDREFLEARLHGRNHWEGYVHEVVQPGYDVPNVPGMPRARARE